MSSLGRRPSAASSETRARITSSATSPKTLRWTARFGRSMCGPTCPARKSARARATRRSRFRRSKRFGDSGNNERQQTANRKRRTEKKRPGSNPGTPRSRCVLSLEGEGGAHPDHARRHDAAWRNDAGRLAEVVARVSLNRVDVEHVERVEHHLHPVLAPTELDGLLQPEVKELGRREPALVARLELQRTVADGRGRAGRVDAAIHRPRPADDHHALPPVPA